MSSIIDFVAILIFGAKKIVRKSRLTASFLSESIQFFFHRVARLKTRRSCPDEFLKFGLLLSEKLS